MKIFNVFAILFTALTLCAESVWFTDPAAATAEAVKENKPLFVLFTAPEWCPPCRKLEKEILNKKDFAAKAAESAVLLRFDVSDLNKVPEKLKKSYNEWLTKHKIQSVPTMMMTDHEGNSFALFNYTANLTSQKLLDQISAAAADWKSPWMKDPEAAMKKAESGNKPVFVLFTAPGWCGPCRQLEARVFNGSNFVEEIKDEVILLELDFSDPSRLPPQLQESYGIWQKRYAINAYPTMILIDPQGKLLKDLSNLRSAKPLLQQIRKEIKSIQPADDQVE